MAIIQKPEVKVRELKNELIKTLRDYCRSQVDLWRQVPELALNANSTREFGCCGRYSMAHLCQLWPLFEPNIYSLCVNLKTGELHHPELLHRVQLGDLSRLLDLLRADKVIDLLRSEIDDSGRRSSQR